MTTVMGHSLTYESITKIFFKPEIVECLNLNCTMKNGHVYMIL
jgi:hypothetical protein